jgi:hypothetical protein
LRKKRLRNDRAFLYVILIPAIQRPRQKDHEFKASLGYIRRPYLKKKEKKERKREEEKGFKMLT